MLTQEKLKSVLEYDPLFGDWRWRKTVGPRATEGMRAGTIIPDGNLIITINNQRYKASHLAWLYMRGSWPKYVIGHRDGNRLNNQWTNLLETTELVKPHTPRNYTNNTSRQKGVTWNKNLKKWVSKIFHNGKTVYLGSYDHYINAVNARKAAENKYHRASA